MRPHTAPRPDGDKLLLQEPLHIEDEDIAVALRQAREAGELNPVVDALRLSGCQIRAEGLVRAEADARVID